MKYIGIDPGKTGSLAIIDIVKDIGNGMGAKGLSLFPVPIFNDDYDMRGMYNLLASNKDNSFAVIERATAMPGQGTVSMFSFGRGYGLWLMALTVSEIPFQIVHSRVWTKTMLVGSVGEGKERGASVARNLFPQWQPKLKKELQYCDSILLAEYARRLKEGGINAK